jgi:hypothetical protein
MDVLLPASRKLERRSERSDDAETGAAATDRACVSLGKVA